MKTAGNAGLFSSHDGRILPGSKPVLELLRQAPRRIEKLYCKKSSPYVENADIAETCRKNGIPVEIVDGAFLDSLCRGRHASRQSPSHQGLVALLAERRDYSLTELFGLVKSAPLPVLVALDQIQDPGNFGTLCRTAYALGCAGMLLPRHNSSSLGPAAMRSSAGALEKMPLAVVTNLARALDAAEETGLHIYAASCVPDTTGHAIQANAFNASWDFPAVLVLGNENRGIRPGVAKRCGTFVTIPLARKFDSLNIAQAGAILLGLCAASWAMNHI